MITADYCFYMLVFICLVVTFISALHIWQVLHDCKKRRLRRERIKEAALGRAAGNNTEL